MTSPFHRPSKPSSSQSARSGRGGSKYASSSSRPISQPGTSSTSNSIYFSPRGGIAAPIPYIAKPHPDVQFVAKPITEERTLSEALSGVVLNDDQYQDSLKRLLGFQSHRLSARTVPIVHEVHEERSPKNHVGSPSKVSVVLASSKQQHQNSLEQQRQKPRQGGRPPVSPRQGDPSSEIRILAIDQPDATSGRRNHRSSTASIPDFSYSASGAGTDLEPMVFTTRPRQDSIVYNRTSTPSASVTSGGRRKQKSGRLHWTQLSLHEPVDEDERSFQWAIACARGIYHNQLPSCISDGGKAKPLPPVVKKLSEQQRKEKLPELNSSSAIETTERLYTKSKAVRLSQTVAPVVRREKIGNYRSFKEAMAQQLPPATAKSDSCLARSPEPEKTEEQFV